MVTRRIVASVCAMCLAVPAAAVASPGTDPPKAQGPYGSAPVTGPPVTAEARGPYGVTPVTGPPISAGGGSTHPSAAARSDSTAGWRIVALCEAAVLAAVALGAVHLVPARRRAPRMVT